MTEEEKKLKIIAEILKTLCEIKEIKKEEEHYCSSSRCSSCHFKYLATFRRL
ncbi:MAG: hypothetical protein ACLS9V_08400 [Ruminococcus sp.]